MIRKNSPNYRWYILALAMLTAAFITGAARLCMPVLFKEISGDLGLNLVSIGTIWGMDPLSAVFIGLPSGLLADRFGIKRTLVVTALLAGVFGAVRGLSTDFFSLAATMFLFGLLSAATMNIMVKVPGLWFRGRRLGMANALLNVAWMLGSMSATMFSATVFSPWLGGWRNVMFLWGIPCILIGLLWLFTGRDPAKNEVPELSTTRAPFRQALSRVMRVKGIWIMGLMTFFHFGATMGFTGYLALYLRNAGWNATAADSALTALSGIGTIGVIPMVLLSDKLKSRKAVLAISLVALTAILALLPYVNSAGVWLLIIIGGFLRAGGPSMINVMVIEMKEVSSEYDATALALANSIGMVGAFLAPPIGNSFADAGGELPFLFWAGLSAVSFIPLFFMKSKTQDTVPVN